MNKEKLVSRRNGEVAEVVKIENGVYTLLVGGKEVKVKEGTIKRWWKKDESAVEVKSAKKATQVKEVQSKKSVEVKAAKKTEKPKVEKSKETVKKETSAKKKFVKVKTSFPLRSFWNFAYFGRHSDLRKGIQKLSKEQKAEMVKYFMDNDKDGKHRKFLRKEGLIK